MLPELPIHDILANLMHSLANEDQAIVLAPPGAGKTSIIPLALLNQAWLSGQKILVLQPRRIAVKSVASRLADLLGEPIGETVGYRVRLESNVSANTRLEVMTEGTFLRLLHADPSLEEVGIVVFDECHERHLDTDLSLALCLSARELFSDLRGSPLKLLMMSATLDGSGLQGMLQRATGAPVSLHESHGKSYPVEVAYQAKQTAANTFVVDELVPLVQRALKETDGSVLVFLPGVGEINRLQDRLSEELLSVDGKAALVELLPLHGSLSLDQQKRVISTPRGDKRRVILSTSIAQTSLTIDGITAVVDSGYIRNPKYDPRSGLTRLHTERISQATATQRAGRAGRLGPGRAYRAWPKEQPLAPRDTPEILNADLAPLLLQVIDWGGGTVDDLYWLDQPPAAACAAAEELLHVLGAVEKGAITRVGRAIMALPTSPRLGRMLIAAYDHNSLAIAANLAAIISNKDPQPHAHSVDIGLRLEAVSGAQHRQIQRESEQLRKASLRWIGDQGREQSKPDTVNELNLVGYLLAHAYPDRIARRGSGCHYKLANGRGVTLDAADPLVKHDWIVVAALGGHSGRSRDRVFLASAFDPDLLQGPLADRCRTQTTIQWPEQGRFTAVQETYLGDLQVASEPLTNVTDEQRQQALFAAIRSKGLGLFTVDSDAAQWRSRLEYLSQLYPEEAWPNASDEGLLASLEVWLSPVASDINALAELAKLKCVELWSASLLVWPQPKLLDQRLPTGLQVPSGLTVALDYQANPPVLAVKLQAMFGLSQTPVLADGRLAVAVHLLSPAGRPLQITQDLAGFWDGSYHEIRKELKGRYPKHPWPEDPKSALPTHRAKPRGT